MELEIQFQIHFQFQTLLNNICFLNGMHMEHNPDKLKTAICKKINSLLFVMFKCNKMQYNKNFGKNTSILKYHKLTENVTFKLQSTDAAKGSQLGSNS